jgi:hypothetical protein
LKTGEPLFSKSFFETEIDCSYIVSTKELDAVKKYLQVSDPKHSPYHMNEVRAVYYSAKNRTIETQIINFFSEDNWEEDWKEVLEDVQRYSHSGGEIHFFPEPTLMLEMFLQARYSDEKGQVPGI